MRYPLRVALSVSTVLAQIGEFSFIVATMGRQLNILPPEAANVLVAAAILSITLNPLLYRFNPVLERRLDRMFPAMTRWMRERTSAKVGGTHTPHSSTAQHRAIVIGYGPVGQTVARLLAENDIEPTIIELNVETVQRLRDQNIRAIYGDASRVETLTQAGIADANALVLSASSIRDGRDLVQQARAINPKIRVLARTSYLRELGQLHAAGVDGVFSGEGEVALAMSEYILKGFGATPEQIDRERERVHSKLFGSREDGPSTAATVVAPR
jgi:CPA2 family monovalent cation:H+ antiporter-2